LTSLSADFYHGINISLHSRIITTAAWFLGLLVVAVLLAAQFSARQPATVSLDVGISVIRLALPLLAILLVQELFSREFERKLYLNSFTYPRQRSYWLLGRVVTIAFLCISLLLITGTTLALLVSIIAGDYQQTSPITLGLPYLITLGFIAIDLMTVIAIATLIAISTTTPSFVLIGAIGFLLIARSYTPIIELLRNNPYVVDQFADPRLYQDSLSLLAFIMPDLGRLDVRMITLYDKMVFMPQDWPMLIGATLAYIAALLGMAVWVLNKREFN
jgi:ABC-type transport system involved in multi-copper enzyme maturation permease subunit